jgi:hypothetical protein
MKRPEISDDLNEIATRFILHAVQEWGQSEDDRMVATQAVIDAAGFDAKATCSPVFGAIWPKPCEGPDSEAASAWLTALTKAMPRGKFEREVKHVEMAMRALRDTP